MLIVDIMKEFCGTRYNIIIFIEELSYVQSEVQLTSDAQGQGRGPSYHGIHTCWGVLQIKQQSNNRNGKRTRKTITQL